MNTLLRILLLPLVPYMAWDFYKKVKECGGDMSYWRCLIAVWGEMHEEA